MKKSAVKPAVKPAVKESYCYVVKSNDGNPYDIGVFMTFESLIKYFKTTTNWKFSDSITPEDSITMCDRVFIDVSEMKIIN